MITFENLLLSKFSLEVRYKKGYLYWDKCGETLLEIEEHLPKFTWQEIGVKGAVLVDKDKKATISFSSENIIIIQEEVENLNYLKEIGDIVVPIVLDKLKARNVVRIGDRFWYLYPVEKISRAREIIENSHVFDPPIKKTKGFGEEIIGKSFVIVLKKEDMKSRIAISSVSRTGYSGRESESFYPKHALMLDIDIFLDEGIELAKFTPSVFIQKSSKIIENNIATLLKKGG